MRSGEAVSGRHDPAAVLPGDVDVQPVRPELDRRPRIVEPRLGVAQVVGGDGHDRREQRGIARNRDVVRGAHEQGVGEVRAVGEVVEGAVHRLTPRRQAQVDDRGAVPDGPVQSRGERQALAPVVRAQHPDGQEGGRGGQAMDDPGAGRAVTDGVDRLVRDDRRVVAVDLHPDALAEHSTDGRMATLDARIDDRHDDSSPAAVAKRPRPIDVGEWNLAGEPGPTVRRERFAPGGHAGAHRGRERPERPRSARPTRTARSSRTRSSWAGSTARMRAT